MYLHLQTQKTDEELVKSNCVQSETPLDALYAEKFQVNPLSHPAVKSSGYQCTE